MKATALDLQNFEIEVTPQECRVLADCLTIALDDIADFEFKMRTSYSKAEVTAVRDQLLAACSE